MCASCDLLDDLRRKQGVTKNFYMFLDEVFKAKAAEMREVGGKKELLTTSMSKTFLNALGENLKAEVLEVILRIMARSIENRSAYSNDMLHIAFDYEVNRKGRLPKETWLFGIIKETILKILSDTENKKDWYWMYVKVTLPLCFSRFLTRFLIHSLTITVALSAFLHVLTFTFCR